MTTKSTEQQARERVSNSPQLRQHENTIFADWPNWDEHMIWLITARVRDIVSWAEEIESAA